MKKVLAMVLALSLCVGLAVPTFAASGKEDSTVTHMVSRGDNLSKLAQIYYGNRFEWKRIYEANKDIVKNPNLIFVGQELVIPNVTEKLSTDGFQKLLGRDRLDNWYNAALGAIYDSAEGMDLSLVFYVWDRESYTWDGLTEEEVSYLLEQGFNRYSSVQKRSAQQLDEILKKYFDINLKSCTIPNSWVYIPDTDCYYSNTNDAYMVHGFTVTEVVYSGDLIHLYYEVEPYRGAFDPITEQPVTYAVLTMEQRSDGGYVVISNQNLAK